MIKKLFGGRKKSAEGGSGKELTIDDLITLERYDEALEKLKARVKAVPKDLHAHLRLADVYLALKSVNKAIDEYVYVADSQAEDGFFDKGIALLAKAGKLAPGDDTIPRRINKYRQMKRLEARKRYAIRGLLANKSTQADSAANKTLEMEMLWGKIAKSHLVAQLDGERLEKLFSVMEMKKVQEGEVIAQFGQTLPLIFLVVDGVVEARADVGGKSFDLRTFSVGDLIGDSALLEHKSWPANYTVLERGTVFTLDRDGMQVAMTGHPDPRAFLAVLRQQHNDRDVAASLARLKAS
ncbi:MAG: cyclic nucleotide-binding domain-containing protein [Acidobacteriota bacterium]